MDPLMPILDSLDRLRAEIQADRIATHTVIKDGFRGLSEDFFEHVSQDRADFNSVGSRLTILETYQKNILTGIKAILVAILGALGTWITTLIVD